MVFSLLNILQFVSLISPEYSLEGLMLKLKLQYFGHLMQRMDSLEKTLMLGKIEGRRRSGQQRMSCLDGITHSVDMVWASSGSSWRTGKPSVHGVTKSQTWLSDWTELNLVQWIVCPIYLIAGTFSISILPWNYWAALISVTFFWGDHQSSQVPVILAVILPWLVWEATLASLASCLQSPHCWGPVDIALCWDNVIHPHQCLRWDAMCRRA